MALKDDLVENEVIRFGEFTLTSGKKSNYYIDIKRASTNPRLLRQIGQEIADLITEERVAGMELGAVPIAVAVSLASGKPLLIIRKREREHGAGKRIEGDVEPGDSVLVVEDVTTTGGSTLETVNLLREAGAIVTRAIVVVDREEGATGLLSGAGVALQPLVKISEIMRK